MNVIRHHDEIAQLKLRGMKVPKRVDQLLSRRGMSQHTASMSTINFVVKKPSLLTLEGLADAGMNLFICRDEAIGIATLPFGIKTVHAIPPLPHIEPFREHGFRNRVGLTKRHKIRRPRLSPMRQVPVIDSQWSMLIEPTIEG